MIFFKSTDEKLEDLGFIKKEDNRHGVIYSRYNEEFKYTQIVSILFKKSGNHILQSYDMTNSTTQFSPVVGLTFKEMKLFLRKMKEKEKGWV